MNRQLAVVSVGLLLLAGTIYFSPCLTPKGKRQPVPSHHSTAAPQSLPPGVMYSSFGPSHSFSSNRWSAGTHAHADWFVPRFSGRLKTLELALDPYVGGKNWQRTAGDLEVFVAQNENGFPGMVLERFSLPVGEPGAPLPTPPLVFRSKAHPKLHVGVKYWVCARSTGAAGWTWHFGDRKNVQNSARESEPGKWASAGDFCYVGAFCITGSTNQDLEAEER
jgi:hypothetical protein